ncbi:TolC family protein [Desulfobulbus sp. AH-315-M07]|nr:TolC family protein [Desulfobulbus sp. AH-315-M07]
MLLAATTSCVSYGAGYQDVRGLVHERIEQDVRWHTIDGSSESDAAAKKLLGQPLTAKSATQIALLNSAAMQAAFEGLGMARGRWQSALRIPNPDAEFHIGFEAGEDSPELEIGLMEDLTELLFTPLRSGVAEAGFDAAKMRVAGSAMDLALEARTAFYNYQADEQILELRRTVLKAAAAQYDAVTRIREAGNISDLEFLTEKALYEEARLAHARAETAFKVSRENMNMLMGLWGREATWTSSGRLPDPPETPLSVDDIESAALERSIDLNATRARYTAAARQANLSIAEAILPELRAGGGAEREDGKWSIGPTVELRVPLFYWGQGEISSAKSEMRREEQMFRALGVRIRTAARSSATRLRAARNRAMHFKNVILPLRERITQETLLHYNAMGIGVLQLLQAKRDQIESARGYVDALREYWIARADVEQLRAGRLVKGAMTMDMGDDSGPARKGGGH